ncbi:hypothetical protein D9V96_019465 [Zobellia laminariae]|uniref:hypothetical protein n=1 Tax=Zobellia laminariae TaxID=248906 RepID=UPI0012D873CF|nr:hypothetical protein [Zobellia laminariae]
MRLSYIFFLSIFIILEVFNKQEKVNILSSSYIKKASNVKGFIKSENFFDKNLKQPVNLNSSNNTTHFKLNTKLTRRNCSVKKKFLIDNLNTKIVCSPAELISPQNQKDIYLSQKERPIFEWKELNKDKPQYYILKVWNDNEELLFSKKTKKAQVVHSKELESVYQKYFTKEQKKIYWEVESHFKKCSVQTSNRNSISGTNRNLGLIADFRNIRCDMPAYDNLGNIHYQGEVYLKNPVFNTTNIEIPTQNFIVTDTGNGNPSNVTQTASPPTPPVPGVVISFPITLAPGDDAIVYFKFHRPVGEVQSALHIKHYEAGFPNLITGENPTEDLPNCICNICGDDGWQIIDRSKHFINIGNFPNGSSAFSMRSSFQILNSSNIQEVKAQIVSIKQNVNDKQCHTCTRDASRMGLFKNGEGKAMPDSGWANSGVADSFDRNNDSFGNKLSWTAQTTLGIDFNTEKAFTMLLSLPDLSSLSCCNSTFTVWVRYTFTDINCQSCETLVSYEYDSNTASSSGIGNGGIGTGVGNQSGVILTPTQLIPKK